MLRKQAMTTFSLIATVLNEGQSIHYLLTSLLHQTRQPDEIVLVDGGSSDETVAIIHSYQDRLPIRLLVEAGCNISRGRNIAIAAAKGEVIVATDAGVRIPPEWFERLTEPFHHETTQVVAGFFRADADPHHPFEVAMSATVLPLVDEIHPQKFLPSSRSVAFRKTAWEAVGGYPEWLDYCEDLVFDLRLKARYPEFIFVPEAYVSFKPRTTWKAFFRQYYRYARGDGKADLWRKRHAIRYITYLILIPVLALLMILVHPLVFLLYGFGSALYLYQPYRRLFRLWGELDTLQKLLAVFYVPLIRIVGDIAKLIGYPAGWVWRWRNHPPDWRSV
jgi:glycosyltransferase involved in cell wall biosynthesis